MPQNMSSGMPAKNYVTPIVVDCQSNIEKLHRKHFLEMYNSQRYRDESEQTRHCNVDVIPPQEFVYWIVP